MTPSDDNNFNLSWKSWAKITLKFYSMYVKQQLGKTIALFVTKSDTCSDLNGLNNKITAEKFKQHFGIYRKSKQQNMN